MEEKFSTADRRHDLRSPFFLFLFLFKFFLSFFLPTLSSRRAGDGVMICKVTVHSLARGTLLYCIQLYTQQATTWSPSLCNCFSFCFSSSLFIFYSIFFSTPCARRRGSVASWRAERALITITTSSLLLLSFLLSFLSSF